MQPPNSINTATSSTGRLPLLNDQEVGVVAVGEIIDEPKSIKRGASIAAVAFVLLNTALGSGILGLPGAFAKAGMFGGIGLLAITSVLAVIGVHLLCEVADRVGRPASFYSVSQAAAGAQPAGKSPHRGPPTQLGAPRGGATSRRALTFPPVS